MLNQKLENNPDGFAVFNDQDSSVLIYGVSVDELVFKILYCSKIGYLKRLKCLLI